VELVAVVEANAHAHELGADVGDEAGAEELAAAAEAKAYADGLPNYGDEAVELDTAAKK
jgi:hypothetical protein